MKIVVNKCYGGFSLSREAVKRLAELQGRECYFFTLDMKGGALTNRQYVPSPEREEGMFWHAFDIPNPNEVLIDESNWREMSDAQKKESGDQYAKHTIDERPSDRTDPLLIRVVEELGVERASGYFAELRIIEIPDGVEWEIDEYDGIESVHEKHRSW